MQQAPSHSSSSTRMTGDIVIKFYFGQKAWVPEGIPCVDRLPDEIQDQVQASKTSSADQATVGRHRHGRVDTGTPVFGRSGLSHVQMAALRNSLRGAGYALVDIHYFTKQYVKKGQKESMAQYVVALTFYHNTKMRNKQDLTESQRRVLTFLYEFTWGSCHVWDNTNTPNNNYTVNLTGLLGDMPHHRRLAIRRGKFVEIGPDTED